LSLDGSGIFDENFRIADLLHDRMARSLIAVVALLGCVSLKLGRKFCRRRTASCDDYERDRESQQTGMRSRFRRHSSIVSRAMSHAQVYVATGLYKSPGGSSLASGVDAKARRAELETMELTNIIFEQAAIATLTVNRPTALNALNREVLEEMARVIREVRHDESVRVLIVTGAGDKAFVAGADIAAMAKMSAIDGIDFSRLGHRVMESFEDLPIPVIAAVNGFALGGGLELALACDLIIASDKARFGQPEINLGLIPGFGGTQRLPRLVGEARALEMNLTGEPISAELAEAIGLANRVVPDHELLDTAVGWARKLAAQPPLAVEQIKRLSGAGDLDQGIEAEKRGFAEVFASDDAREGISAFLQKRPARFTGS
jgi:enoyl-CoA hydratase